MNFHSYDNIKIYELSSLSKGPFCGMGVPPNFTSVGNSATVTFTSDHVVEASGFHLDYQCTVSFLFKLSSLKTEVGTIYRILLLILVKMELFKSHFWPLGSKMHLWYCLEVKSDIGKSQKNWNLSRRCQIEGVISLLKNNFFPKSNALEFKMSPIGIQNCNAKTKGRSKDSSKGTFRLIRASGRAIPKG